MTPKNIWKWIVPCLAILLLAACSSSGNSNGNGKHSGLKWETTHIPGVMPNLQFTLSNTQGKTVHAGNYRGTIDLLYFGYTNCPDVCPLTLATIRRALSKLGKKARQVRFLFVSVDPKRDTPKVLQRYVSAFGPNFIGLTGTQKQLQTLAKRYRVSYSYEKPNAKGQYTVNHSSGIFVFDRKGRIQLLTKYKDGAKAIAHDLRQLIAQ